MPMPTLHVTNGDAAAGGLARSGLTGDVLSWRDVLHDGPVPGGGDAAALRQTRAAFLASRGWTTDEEAMADLEARDARLAEFGAGTHVALWFEPDLYDQLQLAQVLARLADLEPEHRPLVTIAPADLYLGTLAPEKFAVLHAQRRDVRERDLFAGREAWQAFTAGDPRAMSALATIRESDPAARSYDADADVRLPYLAPALRRMLEEFPDVEHGLSRSERQICEALAPGAIKLGQLYQRAHHQAESWTWLGDSSFAWYVQRLSNCSTPLVTHTNGTRVIAPRSPRDAAGLWDRAVELTAFGHDVVRARADHMAVNKVERNIGGTEVSASNDWRWDARVGQVTRQ